MKTQTIAAIGTAAACLALAGCGSASHPPARDAQTGCLPGARAVISTAPASPNDPATYQWLVRLDRLRDAARKAGDATSRQLAAELDWAGGRVALDDYPPQLAIIRVVQLCSDSDFWLNGGAASPGTAAAARGWIRANQPPARPGSTAGIVIGFGVGVAAPCPAVLASDSRPAVGNCNAWTVTLATAAGTIRASCGDMAAHAECMARSEFSYYPELGDELYVPAGGQVTRAADISVISQPPGDQR